MVTGESSWSVVGSLPRSLYWISGATLSMNNKIYIFGEVLIPYDAINQHIINIAGGDEGAVNKDIKDIIEFDANEDTWKKIGEMNRGRYRHATAIIEADPEALCGTS